MDLQLPLLLYLILAAQSNLMLPRDTLGSPLSISGWADWIDGHENESEEGRRETLHYRLYIIM